MKTKVVKRNSSIELLRIISMFLIVISHASIHGAQSLNMNFSFNKILLNIMCLGNLGTVIFIIISGYFYDSNIKIKKILKIIGLTTFYSLIFYFINSLFVDNSFNLKEFITQLFSFFNGNYWFITAYVLILLFQPYFKIIIKKMNKSEFEKFLLLLLIIWGIIPFGLKGIINSFQIYSNHLTDLIIYYFIGAYLKKFKGNTYLDNLENKNIERIVLHVSNVLLVVSVIFINILSVKIPFLRDKTIYFLSRNSILIMLVAISVFRIFEKKNYCNDLINKVALCTLGIYLIHDNIFMRNIFWNDVFNIKAHTNSGYAILYLLLASIFVYVFSVLIEYIRITIKKIILKGR